jgi:hypothetical protein
MKKALVVSLLVLALTLAASAKKINPADFNLTIHLTAVDREQGYKSNGRVDTDSDGKVSGSSHGRTFTYLIYTVKIEGKPVTYQMQYTARWGFHKDNRLHLGDYKAYWKNSTTLDVLLTDDKGREKTESLLVVGEQQGGL